MDQTGISLATAWTHDLIASDHPLFAGRPGTIGTRSGNFCLQNADLVLVIGSRLNIRQTSYNWDSFGKNAWIVQVDVDAAELAKPGVQADLRVKAAKNVRELPAKMRIMYTKIEFKDGRIVETPEVYFAE